MVQKYNFKCTPFLPIQAHATINESIDEWRMAHAPISGVCLHARERGKKCKSAMKGNCWGNVGVSPAQDTNPGGVK